MLAVTGITNKSLRALMTGLLDGTAATSTGSPATGYALRSSTPNSMTASYALFSLPISHRPRCRYETHRAPSRFTSQNAIDAARLLPKAA